MLGWSIVRRKYQTMGSGLKASLNISLLRKKRAILAKNKFFQNEGVGNVTQIKRARDKTIHLTN